MVYSYFVDFLGYGILNGKETNMLNSSFYSKIFFSIIFLFTNSERIIKIGPTVDPLSVRNGLGISSSTIPLEKKQ